MREAFRGTMMAIIASLLLLDSPLAAQSSHPFSTLQLVVAGAVNADLGDLAEFWSPRHGALIRLATPFYLGSAAAAFHNESFAALSHEQPDFHLRTFTVEWNASVDVTSHVQGFGGVHVGGTAMNFLEREITHNADENEFLLGVQAGLSLAVARGFGATIMAARREVFTHDPLRLTFIALGAHYSRATPTRLREILE